VARQAPPDDVEDMSGARMAPTDRCGALWQCGGWSLVPAAPPGESTAVGSGCLSVCGGSLCCDFSAALWGEVMTLAPPGGSSAGRRFYWFCCVGSGEVW